MKKPLTEKQTAYVENRMDGKSKYAAAKAAGYGSPDTTSTNLERSASVAAALKMAREELSTATQIKRADVIEMFTEAYDLAKLAAEPGNMVAAAREIGKMLGYYEPERIKVDLTLSQERTMQKFTQMSDEELIQIAQGQAKVIDGECVRLS